MAQMRRPHQYILSSDALYFPPPFRPPILHLPFHSKACRHFVVHAAWTIDYQVVLTAERNSIKLFTSVRTWRFAQKDERVIISEHPR